MTLADSNWWRQAVVYQIYPRSFADSNADGLGDLEGIISRVPYLSELGIDAVWLSPFYPSALADGGYDVDDYRAIDPRIGTLEQFDVLVERLHEAGIRLIVDIVPNHSSNRHVWFQEALNSPAGSPARDRYIFRDGLGPNKDQAPSDWTAMFGGSTWEPVGDGQFYLHSFAPEQPDFNWDNPEVQEEFLKTLRFWADRGVSGFRVDVAQLLKKDLSADPLPSQAQLDAMPVDGTHPLTDRDEVQEIYAQWREVLNTYDPPRTAVAEAWVDADRRPLYASQKGLGQAFNFDLLEADFNAEQFRNIINKNLELAARSGSSSTWVLSNHDMVRHATRYALPPRNGDPRKAGNAWLLSRGTDPIADVEVGVQRARAATLLMLALPGSAYIYQGEELGLPEVADIPDDQRQDPTFFRSPGVDVGRDGARVPIPWTQSGPSFGFGEAGAHLPQPAWFGDLSVEIQEQSPDSTLNLYRRALHLRRQLESTEELEWLETPAGTLGFRRPNGWVSFTNFSGAPVAPPAGELRLTSGALTEDGLVPPATTVWLT